MSQEKGLDVRSFGAKSDSLTINGEQAALHYSALGIAIERVDDVLKLKSAAPFKTALTLERAAYQAERDRMASAFPEVKDEVKP